MREAIEHVPEWKLPGGAAPERFTLHDFRRTAITGMQMAVSEKEASVMVGPRPEVMRRHRSGSTSRASYAEMWLGAWSVADVTAQSLRAVARGLSSCHRLWNGLSQLTIHPKLVCTGRLVKLADTQDLGSCAARRRGSSPRAAT